MISKRVLAILFLIIISITLVYLCVSERIPNIGNFLHTVIYAISGLFLIIGLVQGYNVVTTPKVVI